MNRAVIRTAVEDDYDVIEAKDGEEAIEILSGESQIDLVITDMMMHRMDGFELIKIIRLNPENNHIVIIANTQYEDMTKEKEVMKLGANAIMYKPNTPEDIRKKINDAIAN